MLITMSDFDDTIYSLLGYFFKLVITFAPVFSEKLLK